MKLTALAAAWLVGLALAYGWYDADPLPILLMGGSLLTAALAGRLWGVPVWPAVLVGVCLLGLWRFEAAQASPPAILVQGQVSVQGRVVSDPEGTSTRTKFTLELEAISRNAGWQGGEWAEQEGKALVYAHPPAELVDQRSRPYFRYGDHLQLTGSLTRPEPIEDFDYPAYLESQGIYAVLWAQEAEVLAAGEGATGGRATLTAMTSGVKGSIYDLRRRLAASLETALPPTEAALAQALLLGLRGQLPDAVVENFRQTGTAHLLAISGLHLGILLILTVGLLHRLLGQHTAAPIVLALGMVWLYVLVSGAPASVVRAAIMGSVYLAAMGLGRPRESLLPALALSAVVMTALEPAVVSQISFQLSFTAMAGIALTLPWHDVVAQAIANRMERAGWAGGPAVGVVLTWLASGVIISAAATVATFPLVALNFGRLPLLGIPTTILATPLLPFALVGGMATGLAGMVHPLLGQIVGLVSTAPLTGLLKLVEAVPGWTLAVGLDNAGLSWVWYGALLAALVLADTRLYRVRVLGAVSRMWGLIGSDEAAVRRGSGVGVYFGLTAIALVAGAGGIYLLAQVLDGGDGLLHVHFLDVGQGDSIFIVTPGGKQVLVDGGPEFGSATRELSERMGVWDRSLDLVAATHLDADHSRGLLRALDSYQTETVAAGYPDADSSLYPQWRKVLERGQHRVVRLTGGQTIALDEGVTLETLHPPPAPLRGPAWNANNNSLVFRLVYGEVSFLLTGDIEAEAERYLARNIPGLESDVLKAAHHGSNSSTTGVFLRVVQPRWAVISAGRDNQYGHPHPAVIGRLEDTVGRDNIFSTATQGSIHFSTDGRRLWAATER